MYMAIKYYGTAQASIPAFAEVKDPAAMLASLQKTVSSYEKELNQQQEALQSVMDKLEQERTRHLDKVARLPSLTSKSVSSKARRWPTACSGTKPKPAHC